VNNNQWFLNKNEQQILLNNILKSVWLEPIVIKKNIDEYINEYKRKYSNFWDFTNSMLKKWDSNIEEKFLKKFILNKPKFPFKKFKNSLIQQKNIV
jgi:hypothetical protein